MSDESVVFVVAHPDDVAFFMGGAALLLKDRCKLHVICATRGERGYPWKGPWLPLVVRRWSRKAGSILMGLER